MTTTYKRKFNDVHTITLPCDGRPDAISDKPVLLRTTPPSAPRPLPHALDVEDIDQETWRRIELVAWKPDEETCDVVLLRPKWWIEQSGAKVGGLIRLALPEMGLAGPAKVLSIGPCPSIKPEQRGTQVVTGTFKHKTKMVLHLFVEGLADPIGVTPNHPMFSLDRGDFVAAGALRAGELLKTFTGATARVVRLVPVHKVQCVYNLEVHRDHTYYVSNLAILVHNMYEVGTHNALSKLPQQGTQLNHLPQSRQGESLIGNWNPANRAGNELVIRTPISEHELINAAQAARTVMPASARQLLAQDIRLMRQYTDAPNSALRALIAQSKNLHLADYLALHR